MRLIRLRSTLLGAALLALAAVQANAQTWQFMGDANLFLGQYFFKNSPGSLNGYTDVNAQLIRNLSVESGYYFDMHSVYTGFKQVNELAGGGTLFQQSWDNSTGFK